MKKTKRKVRKCGNSLAIGMTDAAIQNLGLEEGDLVEIKTKGKSIVIKKVEGEK